VRNHAERSFALATVRVFSFKRYHGGQESVNDTDEIVENRHSRKKQQFTGSNIAGLGYMKTGTGFFCFREQTGSGMKKKPSARGYCDPGFLDAFLDEVYHKPVVPGKIEGFLVSNRIPYSIVQIIMAQVADLVFPDMEDSPAWIQYLDLSLAHIACKNLHTILLGFSCRCHYSIASISPCRVE
jgi:hypothetical protein